MIVAGRLRRKTKITSTTSTMASTSSKKASETEERITPVLSATTVDMHAGRQRRFSSCGSCFMIWLTVSITLAPGWRCTLSTMAGVSLNQAPCSTFWAAWLTVATSRSRTGAPFW